MIRLFKRNYLWILLFGSLIGLNETLIGSINMPYRSVVLSTITLTLLSLARSYFPKKGTSMLIIIIAVLFKINSLGIHTCTPPAFLCGPTALLLLGIGYEVFASVFIKRNQFRYSNYLLTCVLTSLVTFCVYAILQTYILRSWDTDRLINYISVRGSLTAIASSAFSIFGLYLAKSFGNVSIARFNPYVINGILGSVIIALWVLGYYSV